VLEERAGNHSSGFNNMQLQSGFNPESITDNELLENIASLDKNKGDWKKNIAVFLFSVLLFAGIGLIQWKPIEVAILLVVIFIHELGHFIGMKSFGYLDPKIFFIPGLGAAASARKTSGNAKHDAIVSLLGPIPGIFIGIMLVLIYYSTEIRLIYDFAELFLFINLFNLLPISPLDGGRFFEAVLFRRNHIAELIFRIITGLILLAIGIASKSPLLIIFPAFFLFTLPEIFRISKAAKTLKNKANREISREELLQQVRQILRSAFQNHQSQIIYTMRAKRLLESISEFNMALKVSIVMVIVYLFFFPIALIAGGTAVYLFKKPSNLSAIKNRNHLATFNPGKNKNVVNPFVAKQLRSLKTVPFMPKDNNKIIEKKSSADIHVGLIAVGTSEEAKAIKQSILSGISFEEVAKNHSKGPNNKNGGDIGFVNPKDLDKKISDKLLELNTGGISDIIEVDNGYLIVKRIE
jgi:parvulin-like peptidyl-prolyl isomerase/Zn-dependent protease